MSQGEYISDARPRHQRTRRSSNYLVNSSLRFGSIGSEKNEGTNLEGDGFNLFSCQQKGEAAVDKRETFLDYIYRSLPASYKLDLTIFNSVPSFFFLSQTFSANFCRACFNSSTSFVLKLQSIFSPANNKVSDIQNDSFKLIQKFKEKVTLDKHHNQSHTIRYVEPFYARTRISIQKGPRGTDTWRVVLHASARPLERSILFFHPPRISMNELVEESLK